MLDDGVNLAFDLILEELKKVIGDLNAEGAQAFHNSNYENAIQITASGKQLAQFYQKVANLQEEWTGSIDISTRNKTSIPVLQEELVVEQVSASEDASQEINVADDVTEPTRRMRRHYKSPRTGLRVTFPDGSILQGPVAAMVFVETIKRLGIDQVKNLNLIVNSIPLIAAARHRKYAQHRIGKHYIITATSTRYKQQILQRIAQQLQLSLTIDVV